MNSLETKVNLISEKGDIYFGLIVKKLDLVKLFKIKKSKKIQ